MRAFLDAYIQTALWSTMDDRTVGSPLDDNYGPEDLAPETLAAMRRDCEAFVHANADDIDAWEGQGDADARAGHDFWLTRNGHGAGFWDGDWPEPQASRLTAASEVAGEVYLYVGDDGRIYQ